MSQDPTPMTLQAVLDMQHRNMLDAEAARLAAEQKAREALRLQRDMLESRKTLTTSQLVTAPQPPAAVDLGEPQPVVEEKKYERVNQGQFPPPPTGPGA